MNSKLYIIAAMLALQTNSPIQNQTTQSTYQQQVELTPIEKAAIDLSSLQPRPEFLSHFEKTCEIEYLLEKGHHDPQIRADYHQSPSETLELGTGDCEDMSDLLMHYFAQHDIDAKRVSGWGNFFALSRHAWVEINHDGKELILEATLDKIIDKEKLREYENGTHQYYLTDKDLSIYYSVD